MPDVVYSAESVSVMSELMPLVQAHASEISYGITRDDPLDVDIDTYSALYDLGRFRLFTARCDGKLIGYLGFVLSRSLDRRYMVQALECGFFLSPEYRRGRTALRLMAMAEHELKTLGCDVVFYHSPVANPRFGALLSHCGYQKVDEIYARRLPCQVH